MNESFSPYPLMGNSLFQKIGYVTDKAEFSYTEQFEDFPLQLEITSEGAVSCCGKLSDPRCSWYPETHNLKFRKACRFTSAYCLFGEGGIAPSDAVIGLALRWISSKSDERGLIPFGEITRLDSSSEFSAEGQFDKGKLKGSLKFQTILYLKESGTPRSSEMYFAQQPGTVLGILDHAEFYIDGNGSIFPIVVVDAPGKPLWHVYYNETVDAMQDCFDSENVEIRLNKVIASALMVIVESVKESLGEEWDTMLSGTGFESGSIAEAIYYFVSRLQWDISNPAKLSESIREFFERSN